MRQRLLSLLLSVICSVGTALPATVIDFESLNDGDTVTNQLAGLGVTLQNAIALTAGLSLNELEFPPFSGTNVIGDNGGAITITFSAFQSMVFGNFTYSAPLTLRAFDIANTLLGSAFSSPGCTSNLELSGTPGCPANEQITLLGVGDIARVTITGASGGSSFTLDDLTFEPALIVEVPEPAMFPLALVALAALALRQRRVSARRN